MTARPSPANKQEEQDTQKARDIIFCCRCQGAATFVHKQNLFSLKPNKLSITYSSLKPDFIYSYVGGGGQDATGSSRAFAQTRTEAQGHVGDWTNNHLISGRQLRLFLMHSRYYSVSHDVCDVNAGREVVQGRSK